MSGSWTGNQAHLDRRGRKTYRTCLPLWIQITGGRERDYTCLGEQVCELHFTVDCSINGVTPCLQINQLQKDMLHTAHWPINRDDRHQSAVSMQQSCSIIWNHQSVRMLCKTTSRVKIHGLYSDLTSGVSKAGTHCTLYSLIRSVIWPSWLILKMAERQHWFVQARTDEGLFFFLFEPETKAVVIISHFWFASLQSRQIWVWAWKLLWWELECKSLCCWLDAWRNDAFHDELKCLTHLIVAYSWKFISVYHL